MRTLIIRLLLLGCIIVLAGFFASSHYSVTAQTICVPTIDCTTVSEPYSTNTYTPSGYTGNAWTVSCPNGYVATGGGQTITGGLGVDASFPHPSDPTKWVCDSNGIFAGTQCSARCCRL